MSQVIRQFVMIVLYSTMTGGNSLGAEVSLRTVALSADHAPGTPADVVRVPLCFGGNLRSVSAPSELVAARRGVGMSSCLLQHEVVSDHSRDLHWLVAEFGR